jgi:hypothetical protein
MNLRDQSSDLFRPIAAVDFSRSLEPFSLLEVTPFIILGLLLGLFAAVFALLTSTVAYYRRRITMPTSTYNRAAKVFFGRWYLYPLLVVLVTAVVVYPGTFGDFASLPNVATFKDMTSPDLRVQGDECKLKACDWASGWFSGSGAIYANLAILFAIRFLLTPLIITLPFPVGLFFPAVVVGSIAGRFAGEVMHEFFGEVMGIPIMPQSYAIVGAAAFVCSFTHTLSPSIVVMEITGSFRLFFPVIFASIAANWVAAQFLPSIYDCLAYISGLKLLPHVTHNYKHKVASLVTQTLDEDEAERDIDEEMELLDDGMKFDSAVRLVAEKFNEFDASQQLALRNMGIRPLDEAAPPESKSKLPSIPIITPQSPITVAHGIFTALKTPILLVASVEQKSRIVGVLSRNVVAARLLKHIVSDFYWLRFFVK